LFLNNRFGIISLLRNIAKREPFFNFTKERIVMKRKKRADTIVYSGWSTFLIRNRSEVVQTTDSVGFLFVDTKRELALLLSMPRAAMVRRGNSQGMIVEVPAGRRDCKLSLKRLVVKEAIEEAGLLINPSQVKILNGGKPLALSPGILTERMYLAYAELDLGACLKNKRKIFGLKSEGERIQRRVVSFKELECMKFEDLKTYALVQWFLKSQLQKEGK
jgi:hypothetical protein